VAWPTVTARAGEDKRPLFLVWYGVTSVQDTNRFGRGSPH